MRSVLFLLRKFAWPHSTNLLSFALVLSVIGVALGIAQLMLVLGVMSGFQKMLRENYTQITGDLVVIPNHENPDALAGGLREMIKKTRGVLGVTPFAFGQAMIVHDGATGVAVEAMDPSTAEQVTDLKNILVDKVDKRLRPDLAWIWVGSQLAKKVKIKAGDVVELMVAQGNERKFHELEVTGITRFGIYQHDLRYARVSLATLARVMGQALPSVLYKCRLDDKEDYETVVERVQKKLAGVATVQRWYQMHANTFRAVEHQKYLLFLVLEIIMALAAMNIVNLLMMNTYHRRRDIAIWRAMGMRVRSVSVFFIAQGGIVGASGIILGIGLGMVLCQVVERFQPSLLTESMYNVTRLPMHIAWQDVGMISAAAMAICLLFSVGPALRAAYLRPVEALRNE